MASFWESLQGSMGTQLVQVGGALLIFVVGWFVAVAVRAAARKGLGLLKLNQRFGGNTGKQVDVEGVVALALFWIVLLITFAAVFNALNLGIVSGPFMVLTTQVFEFVPRIVAALILALIAWLLASVLKGLLLKLLSKTTLDEKLSEHANMAPLSEGLSQALFWVVILMFVPPILGTLQMTGLLDPLTGMLGKALDMLPNVVAALVIGGLGWVIATVLRNLTTNLLRATGADAVGDKAGLAGTIQISGLAGLLVFIGVFVPALIAALDALKIEAISGPATDMLAMLLDAVPRIVAAGLIMIITWMVASFASRLLSSLLAAVGLDSLPARVGMAHAFSKTPASALVGHIALTFAMLFAAVEAGNQLGFARFSDVITTFIEFAGDVLLGSVILIIGFMLANVAATAIERAGGDNARGLARVARFAILGIVLAMGLRAMGIADDIVNLAFGLTLGAIAVAVALSFGLGGREAAGRLMSRWLDRVGTEAPTAPTAPPVVSEPPRLPGKESEAPQD